MSKKYRILFVVPTFYGHIAPSLPIAKQLKENGHTVGYCTGPPARQLLLKNGIDLFYPRPVYHDAIMDKENSLVKWWYEFWFKYSGVFTRSVMADSYHELVTAFECFKPDVVYIDTFDVFGATVAEKYNLPYVHGSATTIIYLEKGIPPIATNWSLNTPWRNRLKWYPFVFYVNFFLLRAYLDERRALRDVDPAWKRKQFNIVSPYLYLLYSTDKVEYPRKTFVPQIFYIGPSILEPEEGDIPDFPWEKLDSTRPMIYIAAGTLFYEHYRQFYKDALTALDEKKFPVPVQVVMAIGKPEYVRELGEIPPNFIVVPYAPQIRLLPKADVVVTHGGVNSVNEAFMCGKPMLVVHWGGDRVDMGRRIENINAGISFDVDASTPEKIGDAVLRLLRDPAYRRSSENVMHDFRQYNAAETGAHLIVRLAETGKPILRRKQAPITLKTFDDFPGLVRS